MGCRFAEGRFHVFQQLTSYASNNFLVCIAEKLFYMSRTALEKLTNNSYGEFRGEATRQVVLVIFKCSRVSDLVYIESTVAIQTFALNPSTITHPDFEYEPLRNAANKIRPSKQGILYPSARHSEGWAICFFWDHSQTVKHVEAKVKVKLSLASEDLKFLADDPNFDPVHARLSHTTGYFEIDDFDFRQFKGLMYPNLPQRSGYIEFRRIPYEIAHYPACAMK